MYKPFARAQRLQVLVRACWVSGLTALSCAGNNTTLAARKTGDLPRPLAERRPSDESFLNRCGDGSAVPGAPALGRSPYMQAVTANSAIVAFSTVSTEPIAVDVSTPEGEPVLSVTSEVDAPAGPDGPATWVARLTGLTPLTEYCYALRGITERAGFLSGAVTASDAPVRFIAFGDSGSGSQFQRTMLNEMLTVPFDFALHLGDIAYEKGKPSELEAKYFRVYGDLSRSFPVYPIAGNHDDATRAGAPFRQAFVLPTNGGDAGRERWYSFDRGNAHFVGLDTERIDAEQAAWLEQDLSANQLPWTIVYAHKPPFSSGAHGGDANVQRMFVPILARHQVALVLSGHEHNYERFRPIDGVVYVVSGGGGRETRSVGAGDRTAFSESVLHFVYVEIVGDTLTLHAIDGIGREFDQAVVVREGVGAAAPTPVGERAPLAPM